MLNIFVTKHSKNTTLVDDAQETSLLGSVGHIYNEFCETPIFLNSWNIHRSYDHTYFPSFIILCDQMLGKVQQ